MACASRHEPRRLGSRRAHRTGRRVDERLLRQPAGYGTTWQPTSDTDEIRGRDRETGELKWTWSRVGLVFGSTPSLRAGRGLGNDDAKEDSLRICGGVGQGHDAGPFRPGLSRHRLRRIPDRGAPQSCLLPRNRRSEVRAFLQMRASGRDPDECRVGQDPTRTPGVGEHRDPSPRRTPPAPSR